MHSGVHKSNLSSLAFKKDEWIKDGEGRGFFSLLYAGYTKKAKQLCHNFLEPTWWIWFTMGTQNDRATRHIIKKILLIDCKYYDYGFTTFCPTSATTIKCDMINVILLHDNLTGQLFSFFVCCLYCLKLHWVNCNHSYFLEFD